MFKSRRFYSSAVMFLLFLAVPACPWYVPFLIGTVASWYFFLYEFMVLGFLMDLQFGSGSFVHAFGYPLPLFFTIVTGIIIVVLQTIKNKVRFYS